MRKCETFNKLLGKKKGGEFVFLEECFEYEDGMSGLCGYELEILTSDEYEERRDMYYSVDEMKDLRKCPVSNDKTELGLDERVEQVKRDDELNGYNAAVDDSFSNYMGSDEIEEINKHGYDFEYSGTYTNCISCGRCFEDEDIDKENREFTTDFFDKFVELYKKYEK